MEESKSTTEAAKQLGIGASTLRKYAAALEEQGYVFQRSANQSRMFSAEDVECLKVMRWALREQHMTMEQAVQVVLERVTAPFQMEDEEFRLPPISDAESLTATWEEIMAAAEGREETVMQAQAAATVELTELQDEMNAQELSEEPMMQLQSQEEFQTLASTIEYRLEQAPVSVQTQESVEPQELAQMQDMVQNALLEMRSRLEELEAEHSRLVEKNISLSNQLEDQKRWMKERIDEERDRQLITNLRTYQGRQRKSRGSLLSWLGLTPRRRREA